MIQRYSILH